MCTKFNFSACSNYFNIKNFKVSLVPPKETHAAAPQQKCLDQWCILVHSTSMEPKAWAVKVQSPDHWTAREFPTVFILGILKIIISQTRRAFLKLTSL